MSLLNKASLIQIPSGYKDGTLYSAKPTNGDGDFTFSRGSNLAATRVNSEGLIEKGRENLLLQSNSFDTTWSTTNTSVTGGQSGYDGSSDAWLLNITGGSSDQRIFQSVQYSGVSTLSVYAKKNDSNWLSLRIGSSVNKWYDLENGVLGGSTIVTAYIDASIEDVGNGWYRCSLTFTDNFNTSTRIYPAEDNLDITHTSGSIYIQDAQVEVGLVATDYIETTTTTEQAGILEDMPRLDYSGGATCPSLLLEPQRSNLIVDSENYSSGQWGKTRSSVDANSAISPEGNQNAFKLIEDSSNNSHFISDSVVVANSTSYTYSVFAKKGERSWVALYNNFSGTNTFFDLENGVVGSVGTGSTASIEDYGNGWYRCAITLTSTSTSFTAAITICTADNTATYQGDGSSEIYVYGAQLEAASYPTSYIPTYGGSSVTRSQDICTLTNIADIINSSEGVLYAKISALSDDLTNRAISLSDGTLNNGIHIEYFNVSNRIRFRVYAGGVLRATIQAIGITITNTNKLALKWESGFMTVYVNGTLVQTQPIAATPTGLDRLNFNLGQGSSKFIGKANQIQVYLTALTNDQLASLTT